MGKLFASDFERRGLAFASPKTGNKKFMVSSPSKKEIAWHTEILPGNAKKALDLLAQQKWLKNTEWYLAGGTALALHVGNRQSVDLDFFLPKNDFRIAAVLKHFDGMNWETSVAKEGTIYGKLLGAKVSFIAYPFFVPKQSPGWYGNVRILQPTDIAVMKVIAISQRGRKRDFFDLYWCVKNLESLEQIMRRLNTQYPTVTHNYHHIIKSLVYFADAEADPTPRLMFRANWKEVKRFFQNEASELVKKLVLE